VDTVIQVFPPAKDLINYVHRSGRTGRANAPGVSILLYTQEQSGIIQKLERKYGIPFKHRSAPTAEQIFEAAVSAAEKVIEEKISTATLPPDVYRLSQNLVKRFGARALEAALLALVERIYPQKSTYTLLSNKQRKKQQEEFRYQRKLEHQERQKEKEARQEKQATQLVNKYLEYV